MKNERNPSFQVCDAYIASDDAYYFQRSPTAFEAIFQYYATGVVHRPSEVENLDFLDFSKELPNLGVSSLLPDRARLLADIAPARRLMLCRHRPAEEGRREGRGKGILVSKYANMQKWLA